MVYVSWGDSDFELVCRLERERDEARAEVERLTKERDCDSCLPAGFAREQARANATEAEVERLREALRDVAERQREACADAVARIETDYDGVHVDDPEEVCRATPLVTEDE